MDLAHILDLIRQHGPLVYAFLFVYAAAHGMLIAIFAGYAAQAGALDVMSVLAACGLGSFIGDALRFAIARHFGMSWCASFPRIQAGLHKVTRLADRHYWLPMLHRYPHGLRNLCGFAFGLSNMPVTLFFTINFISALLWALLTVLSGYGLGHISDQAIGETASQIGVALLIGFLILVWLLNRRLERALESPNALKNALEKEPRR